jgi:hypothetical protein
MSPQRLQREGRSFLENLALINGWGDQGQCTMETSNPTSVGHLLAEHIHSQGTRQRTPDIDLPQASITRNTREIYAGPSATRRKPHSKSAKCSDTTLVRSDSEPEQHIPGVPGQRSLSPKALLTRMTEVESDTEDCTPEMSGTVLTPRLVTEA